MWKKKPQKQFGPLKNGNLISVAILMAMIFNQPVHALVVIQ
jgi:hypothetical protein